MITDADLPKVFFDIRDKDERFLWVGKPARLPFVASGIPFLLFGLCWGAFDYFGFIRHMSGSGFPLAIAIPFFAIHLIPFWGSVVNLVRLMLVAGKTFYAVTPKRLMMRSGFWGTDFVTMDLDQITNLEVNVNPIESTQGVGSVLFYSNSLPLLMNVRRLPLSKLVAIPHPYDVFKLIKQAVDARQPKVA